MQKLIGLFFLVIGFNLYSQETAGIYNFKVNIDQLLTTQNQLNVPTILQDSLLSVVKRLVTQEVSTKTQWLFPLNKKGQPKKTRNTSTQIGNLPRGTKRQAMKTEYLEYYVKFRINVGVNKPISLNNKVASYSLYKPYVRVKMKAYGLDRRVKYRKHIRLGGFNGINSVNMNVGGTTMSHINSVTIGEVFDMIFKGLDKFEKKVK